MIRAQSVSQCGTQWYSVVLSGTQWHSVALSGTQWHSVVLSQWNSVELGGNQPHLNIATGEEMADHRSHAFWLITWGEVASTLHYHVRELAVWKGGAWQRHVPYVTRHL